MTVTYTNSRGDYTYGGYVRQANEEGIPAYAPDDFRAIEPLYHGVYAFIVQVPNFVEETEGRIVMNITDVQTVMTYVVRDH